MAYSRLEIAAQKAAEKAAQKAQGQAVAAAERAAAEAAAAAMAKAEADAAALAAARVANSLQTARTAAVMPCGRVVGPVSPKITNHTRAHIFEGEHNGSKSTGCHSKVAVDYGKAEIVAGTIEMKRDPPGIYVAKVKVKNPTNGNFYKEKFSTFFPDHWDKDEIEKQITSAFDHPKKIIDPLDRNKWTAKSASGVIISGFTEEDGNIASAFPTGDYVEP